MVDAAGAIYVIGGYSFIGTQNVFFNDVWVSTDGGARPDSVGGRSVRYSRRYSSGYSGGYYVVLRGCIGVLRSTRGGYYRVLRGTTGVLEGYYRG